MKTKQELVDESMAKLNKELKIITDFLLEYTHPKSKIDGFNASTLALELWNKLNIPN